MDTGKLRRVLESGAALASERRVRFGARILLAAALVFVALRLRSIWHDSHIDLNRVAWGYLIGAGLLAGLAVVGTAWVWLAILRHLGVATRHRWTGIYFQAQLGKYLPGSLWQYAGRTALARAHGLPLREVTLSLPAELGGSIVAGAATSLFLFGWWGFPGAAAILVVLNALVQSGRLAGTSKTNVVARAAAQAALPYFGIFLVLGSSFWSIAHGLHIAPVGELSIYIGAFAAAWVVGVVAIYAPGGLGVREAVLVALLRGRATAADALVVAAASRAVLTLVDLAAAGVGAAFMRRGAPSAPCAD